MAIESFPHHPLSGDAVKVIAQQEGVAHVYGLLIGDVDNQEYGFDMNIGLNVGGSHDHDYYFDLVIDTGTTVTVAAYPRPDLPDAEDIGPVDDPLEPITHDDYEWEWIYRQPEPGTAIDDVVTAFKTYRDFSQDEQEWVDGVAQAGPLAFLSD